MNKKVSPKNSLAIIIPMYNEEAVAALCIDAVMKEINKFENQTTLIVVNDGSSDKTKEILELKMIQYKQSFLVVTHKKNMGFGAGNRTGIKKATQMGFTWCLHMDAGLTNDPKHIKVFVKNISDNYDCIKASRYIKGSKVVGVPMYRRIISILGNNLASSLFRVGIKDCTNGFRIVRLSKLKGLTFKENGYGMVLEELYFLKKRKSTFKEIPYTLTMQKNTVSHFSYNPKLFYTYFKFALKSFFV